MELKIRGASGTDPESIEITRPTRAKYADALSREWIEPFELQHNRPRTGR